MAKRLYVVGLPVSITVDDDGTVEYEVDTSEAGTAIMDYEPLYDEDDNPVEIDEDDLTEDRIRVEDDHARRWAEAEAKRGE